MNNARNELNTLLKQLDIEYEQVCHAPLHTCSDAHRLGVDRTGQSTKHLFLRDNYGKKHFVLVTRPEVSVDLKTLSKNLNVSRLGFASEQRLQKYLDVLPGHLSLLALIHDEQHQVEVLLDKELLNCEHWQLLALNNQTTWILQRQDVLRLLARLGNSSTVLTLPTL